jgi:hypothetical protein
MASLLYDTRTRARARAHKERETHIHTYTRQLIRGTGTDFQPGADVPTLGDYGQNYHCSVQMFPWPLWQKCSSCFLRTHMHVHGRNTKSFGRSLLQLRQQLSTTCSCTYAHVQSLRLTHTHKESCSGYLEPRTSTRSMRN